MIIRINLLPKTWNEKAALRNLAIMMGALVLIVALAGFGYNMMLSNDIEKMADLAGRYEQWQSRVQQIQSQTGQFRSMTQPIQAKIDFFDAVEKYNKEYPQLYREVARWTYDKVAYSNLSCDGSSVSMNANCKRLEDVGRYLLNMYRATHLFSEISISNIPGYPTAQEKTGEQVPGTSDIGGEQIGGSQASLAGIEAIQTGVEKKGLEPEGIQFSVNCKLRNPIAAPEFGQGGGNQPGSEFEAGPGGPPGGPGGQY